MEPQRRLFLASAPGYAWQVNRTPYMIQYNLNVQREVLQGTVVSVGYVGSHGVNLISGNQQNPVPYTIDSSGVYHFAHGSPQEPGSGRFAARPQRHQLALQLLAG